MCDQSYILRLHRPYQVMGYGNDEYRYSTDRCVQAAKTILRDFHAAWLEYPFLLSFWLTPSFAYVAGVVTFIHVCYSTDHRKRQSDRNLILQTKYVLRNAENVSAVARNSLRILDGLLTAEKGGESFTE
ncbi:hypothetical protein EHS25_004804 [Saitozyma podzolica]|uniref:Uncharacterized protein n=1 Tax=Saitozyma podzolica TaxID=1890683 RepID=A0A427Y2Q4_9TREE|nr:hypothetical protein EHS25_004804 [Saitozyma podzolica]